MAEIASAFVTIAPSMRGFRSEVTREAGRSGDDASASFGKQFGSKMRGQGRSFGRAFGKAFALGGAAIIAGGTVLLKDSIGAASDLGETINKSNTIFGRNAAVMRKWSKDAATSFGLSREAALASAAGFGDMFTQIGFGSDQAAKMSKSVVKMSADLGSFNNLETADVADRMSAAFRGEYDSLQAVIPNINAARVESEALAKTGKKTAKELTAQEKAAAVLAIVHKDGARAMGDFARTSDGLANQQKILGARFEDVKAKIGTALLPMMVDLAQFANNRLVPVVEDIARFLKQNRAEIAATAQEWGGRFLGALKDVWAIAKPVLTALNELPGPVKNLAAQAVVAALVLPRLTAGLLSARAAASGFATSVRNAETRTAALGSAARGVAGVGGLLAIAQGAQSSNKALGTLATTAGGAALGFSMAGPWGAAVGAVAGLASNFRLAKTAADESRGALSDYKATLDGTTGSLTEATRELVRHRLVESGRMKDLQALGLNERQVINALIGQKGARKALLSVIAAERRAIDEIDLSRKGEAKSILGDYNPAAIGEKNARLKSVEAIMGEIGAVDRAVKAKRSEIRATQDLSGLVGKLPRAKVTKIEATGIEPTIKGVAKVAKQYDLTAREVKAVLRVTGVEATLAQVQKARKGITSVGDVRPSTNWLQHFKSDIASGKSAASSGGSSIGSALGAGIEGGIGKWVGRISTAAKSAVNFAVRAAERAGEIESPSKKTRYVGEMLGLGLAKGIDGTKRTVGLSMERVMEALEAGVKKKDIGKRLAKHVRKGIKAIEREVGQLQKLITARNDMASGIAGGLRGEFDLSAIASPGEPNEFGFSAKAQPVKAAQAIVARMRSFAAKISALVRAKFPAALVQEIAGMGSLEGGKVADAFLKTSARERGDLMKAYSDIATYSRSIGNTVANQQYGGKIRDQRDEVDRMERAIERGLKKVRVDVQLGVGKRDSAKIYIIGKKEAEAKK